MDVDSVNMKYREIETSFIVEKLVKYTYIPNILLKIRYSIGNHF